MSTVSTSHTTVHTRAPLKVPKKPPMNYTAKAIQQFLPIAVAFLVAMVLYSYIRPSTTVYPPYYPPNVGEEPSKLGELGDFARNIMNKRAATFERLTRNNGEARQGRPGEWKVWNDKKTSELKHKLEGAKVQGENVMSKAGEVVHDIQMKAVGAVKSMSEEVVDRTIDAGEWWTQYGEKLVDETNELSTAAQDFAYDAIYAWKQKAAHLKEATKDKLEDLKESGESAIEDLKTKGEEIEETASDILSTTTRKVHRTIEKSVEELSKRLEGLKEGILRAGFNGNAKSEQSKLKLVPQRLDNNTMSSKLSSLIERVKAGLVHDEEVRHALSMKSEWDKVDFEHKVGGIVQQICLLGDDVVEGVLRRLEAEHTQGTCYNHPVCPAA